jgi:hypothetical protein
MGELTEVYYVSIPMMVEIRANSEEAAIEILRRTVFKAEGPQDTKNGAYLIKKVSLDNE